MSDQIAISEGFYEEDLEQQIDDRNLVRCLTVQCGDLKLYISSEYISEIINGHVVSPLPLLPDFLKGIINLRGQILPIVDLRTLLKKDDSYYDEKTCIVVLHLEEMEIGIIVDAALSVEDIDYDAIQPIPSRGHSTLLRGIVHLEDGSVAMGFDPYKLPNLEEMNDHD